MGGERRGGMGGRDGWEGMGSRIEGGKEREEEKGRARAGGRRTCFNLYTT